MRLGTSYMGHHNPRHVATDLADMKAAGCDDVLLAAQENDFVHMTGKLDFFPKLAAEAGVRPIAIFWGALNLFGGGQSSKFLLEHPEGHQVRKDGSHHRSGCYNNPVCVGRIKQMIDRIGELGFEGYFVDEPTPLDCYCPSCRELYRRRCGGELHEADEESVRAFRHGCVIDYVKAICDYCKANHPRLETLCCLMPRDQAMWGEASRIDNLDNLGTDIYWVNNDRDLAEMAGMVRALDAACKAGGKTHHEWLQAWHVKKGREGRIVDQGDVLIRARPDAIYVWAYLGQIGTTESSDDPLACWEAVCEVFRRARGK